ncbi:Protein kinase, ATP binding site,Tyrosine-protein kinase, active site,Protein kinase domain,Protein [Balamuthia mandrillaris]
MASTAFFQRAGQIFLLLCFICQLVSATFRFKGVEPIAPTPGTQATVQFETLDTHAMREGIWRYEASVSTGDKLTLSHNDGRETSFDRWYCVNAPAITNYCSRITPASITPNTIFSGVFTVPSNSIEARIDASAVLTTSTIGTPAQVLDTANANGNFYTGAAIYALVPSIVNHSAVLTPGEVLMLDLSMANAGPSNGRAATCRVQVTVEGSWVDTLAGCTEIGTQEWNCVASVDVPAADSVISFAWRIEIPPYYRGDLHLLVDECSAQGTASTAAPSTSIAIPFGAPSWHIATRFSAEAAQSIEMDNVLDLASELENMGPSTSLSTLCTWRFSVSSLTLEGTNSVLRSCTSSLKSNNEMMEVSCELDVIGASTTIPVLSISAKPELAGTPSFLVTMECVDEYGESVQSIAETSIMVVERLEGVAMEVKIVNGKLADTAQKRQHQNGFTEKELGTTNEGQLIFDEALMFVFNATSEGALYARNITCNVQLGGRDAPLLTPPAFDSMCEDMGSLLSGVRVWRCHFAELWFDRPSISQFVMLPDSRVETFDVAVECATNYPQSITNPVYQQTFQFIHVSNVPGDGDSTPSERADDAESDDNTSLIVGLTLGLILPFMLIMFAALIILFIILRRRKEQRLQQSQRDMERDAEMDVYAPAGNIFMGKEKSEKGGDKTVTPVNENYQRTSTWEIPFAELEFDEEIGKGNREFGTVWRGTWRETTVAIKMFNSIMDSETAKANFKAECEIMKHLRPHTNVMQLFGVSMEGSTPWCLVMEYLAQGNLLHFLQQSANDTNKTTLERNKTAVRMAREIAAGMHHLHSENIVHRDLAARNVLLTGDLTVKVADFGLSTASEEEHSQTIPIRWTPPEYFHKRTFDKKSDVWSYGVLLWELLNEGKTPYPNMTIEEVINAVMDGLFPLFPPFVFLKQNE